MQTTRLAEDKLMMGNVQTLDIQIPHEIVQYWGWFLVFGICLLLLGVVAVARSVTATIVSMLFFGWLLVLACGIEVIQAILVGHWAGFFHHLVAAILFGVTGLLIITRPCTHKTRLDVRFDPKATALPRGSKMT